MVTNRTHLKRARSTAKYSELRRLPTVAGSAIAGQYYVKTDQHLFFRLFFHFSPSPPPRSSPRMPVVIDRKRYINHIINHLLGSVVVAIPCTEAINKILIITETLKVKITLRLLYL